MDLAAEDAGVGPADEERSGADRRVAESDGPPASLRVDRRRGADRRKPAKRQAISRA
jgi:hypothetical protein